jgi:hypothetical protein
MITYKGSIQKTNLTSLVEHNKIVVQPQPYSKMGKSCTFSLDCYIDILKNNYIIFVSFFYTNGDMQNDTNYFCDLWLRVRVCEREGKLYVCVYVCIHEYKNVM